MSQMANKQSILTQRLQGMQQQTHHGGSTNNLYNHLCQLLTQIPLQKDLKGRSLNTIQELTTISEYIKKNTNRSNIVQPNSQQELQERVNKRIQYPQWIVNQNSLIKSVCNTKSEDFRNRLISNFQLNNRTLFKSAGINFGEEESFRINITLKKLAEKVDAKQLRFWGKILTTGSDYYVIQGIATKKQPQKITGSMQKYREGANYYSYWINNSSFKQQWYELPLISPEHIKVARLIKCAFSGNLKKKINSYPKFEGLQQHLLKAQLVRITHNCQIAPKGLYAPTQQNPDEIQFAEQFKFSDISEQTNLQNWTHINPFILELGRGSYWVDPTLPEQQKEELLTKLGESDPKIQRLKQINEDKPPQKIGIQTSWFAKTIGNTQVFNNVGKDEGTTSCYATVILKNVNWPGWTTFGNTSNFASIYIGYGFKATQNAFFPLGPQDLKQQGEDIVQFDQPNPKNPPDELQPDSDDQNKKVQE